MRRRRHVRVPPDLTSLFDVLFIVIFAALIRAAAVEKSAAAKPEPKPPAQPLDPTSLHARAIASLDSEIAGRTPVVVRVSVKGSITAIEVDDKATTLDLPLLEHSEDPDANIAYLGERSADLQICRVVAGRLGVDDLAHHLVIIAPDGWLADLPEALYKGLTADVLRCHALHGEVAIIEPHPGSPGATQ